MALPCSTGKSSIAAQTLFLGASIADFNVNMAWGGRPSQLTVKLVEDRSPTCGPAQFNNGGYGDDHFYDCSSDSDCFIDERGLAYDPNISKEKFVPGKVYYAWNGTKFVSKYWYNQDPGFFGTNSCIGYDGSYNPDGYNSSKGLDIINTPAMFKIGQFTFTGLIQSWEQNYDSGGLTYNVTLESLDSILDNCWIILDKHVGAVFGKLPGNDFGNPTSAIGGQGGMQYYGKISQGNMPNVFNVYGFLESMGIGYFGGSNRNSNGISAAIIMDALSVLTSTANIDELNDQNKRAFSPFGRILVKVAQENESYNRITSNFHNNSFGVLPVLTDVSGEIRCTVALDLTELPRPPLDYRISEPAMSIMSFIQQVTTATGADFYFETIPTTLNSQPCSILKLKTITRSAQPDPRQIQKTIVAFGNNGINASSARLGKEKNTNASRVMYLGASQQRLYQAKCYRLAYSQNQYIYHPVKRKFVEFYDNVAGQTAAGQPGKCRLPSAFSTRNTAIVNSFSNKYARLFNIDEDVKNLVDKAVGFGDTDTVWSDSNLASNTRLGNYAKTVSITKSMGEAVSATRFFPLYKDIISPFFGYKNEDNFTVNTTPGQSNVLRRLRPVWMDSWTGQILVLMELAELPYNLSVPLTSPYGTGSKMFIISESEIRAAAVGLDQFIVYCHGKIFTPDLFKMLKNAYTSAGLGIYNVDGVPNMNTQGNAAGSMGQPTEANPAPNAMEVDYNIFFDNRFMRDLKILQEFVANLRKYYGARYLVRLPEIVAYKDLQYSNVTVDGSLATDSSNTAMQVYHGSAQIFYNYEIATDGAWEEYGNVIDDSILVGGKDWYSITDDVGKIKPILGYNSSQAVDYVAEALITGGALNFINSKPFDFHQLSMYVKNLQKLSPNPSDINNFKYDTIDITQIPQDEFIVKNSVFNSVDAYGISIPFLAKRLYTTTTVESDFAFLDPVNMRTPYAIINASPIPLTSTSKFFTQDPNNTVNAVASMEDLSIYLKVYNNPVFTNDDVIPNILVRRITNVTANSEFVSFLSTNNSTNHHTMIPKVAHPYFAAIPIKSNQYSYGPWINYPHLDKDIIFPDVTDDNLDDAVENLIGGTKVELKSDFAPWNYGGMSFLDQAALGEIYAEVQYQNVIETATLSMPGLPIFNLGSSFEYGASPTYTPGTLTLTFNDKKASPPISAGLPRFGTPVYNPAVDEPTITTTPLSYTIGYITSTASPIAPIISSISCSISAQNIGTTYSFRTYTQKLGFFNKENSDRLKKAGLDSFKANKQLANLSNNFNTKILKERVSAGRDITQKEFKAEHFTSGFYGTSPTMVLIGMARPFGYLPYNIKKIITEAKGGKKDTTAPDIRYGSDPGDNVAHATFQTDPVKGLMQDVRWTTTVGSYMSSEAITELGQSYKYKSAMSMDGIFSPVSFYPEFFNSTYSLTQHTRKYCPHCKGTGKITEKVRDYKNKTESNQDYACPYCAVKKKNIGSSSTSASNGKETLPPYIISKNSDINNILEFNTSGGQSSTSQQSGLSLPVNMVTLQPIVVPYGEFRNNNTQSTDRCRHCISVVARGNVVPKNAQSFNINTNLKTLYDPATGQLATENGTGVNADYFADDILAKFDPANNGSSYPMNQRFFGLRGPIILHGWGYDTAGYPVPNASDEPKIVDANGRPARFNLTVEYESDSTTYEKLKIGDLFIVGNTAPAKQEDLVYYTKSVTNQVKDSNNVWIAATNALVVKKIKKLENDLTTPENGGDNPHLNLGDIITKQYEHNGTKWVKKARSSQFYVNWAERPDIWPVGPIDLRWDDNRRVWTMNTSSAYKFIHITLEEDLVKENDFEETYPARGFLDDIEYSKDPLPQGYRRLVYVKDKTGFTAPKGVKLLCRYDSDSGFYEPVSKPSIVAKGVFESGTQAKIEMDYAQGNRTINSPILSASFQNPLGLDCNSGKKGIFTYMNGQWVVTSA